MAFVDQARIFVQAGNGGKGCQSHYRDRYMSFKKPDGGDGGKGGDVVFVANANLQTLLDYRFRQHYKAERGGHGSSQGKTGRTGEDCVLQVPVGTVLYDHDNGLLIRDLKEHGETVVVAKGGRQGLGNISRRHGVPPLMGEERTVRLELKVIADVGLVGFPNAGKSTLISAISKVKSKIGNYPFTTKQPILGIVPGDEFDFVVADLPGLIEGAHLGKGLGHQFLKHAERTKILVHMIDMAGGEGRDPIEDFKQIDFELDEYSHELSGKHRLIVANKMDAPAAKENLKKFKLKIGVPVIAISALEQSGLDELIDQLRNLLCQDNFLENSKQ